MIKLFFDENSQRISFRQTPNTNTKNDRMCQLNRYGTYSSAFSYRKEKHNSRTEKCYNSKSNLAYHSRSV